ncbi:MAG: glycosyltransferase [Candidatus Paceibacterota bacterium]|jgi:glycosyltransferase involved in cell wall biosynthesis
MTPHTNIIYVNFAPYENAGNILDYLLDHFSTVFSFTFNFHKISANQPQSKLSVYKKKQIVYECRLFQTPTNASVAFILLPIRSLVIFAQLLFHLVRLKDRFGPYSIYFTVNAFTAWAGNILRSLGLVQKTIFWVWDYYPPIHKDNIVRFMRFLYWQFDIPATKQSDHIVFLNKRLGDLRKKLGILPTNISYPVVGIGTNPIQKIQQKTTQPVKLVFIGVLKKSQGLDLVYKSADLLTKKYPNITLHIIGGGPDETHYRSLASSSSIKSIFHGYVQNNSHVNAILKSCHIGIAPYIPDKENIIYYTDPSKIKRYLEVGLPVITTNVFDFSKEISRKHAGIVIPYRSNEFVYAINQLIQKYPYYQKQALLLAQQYRYKKYYKALFTI